MLVDVEAVLGQVPFQEFFGADHRERSGALAFHSAGEWPVMDLKLR